MIDKSRYNYAKNRCRDCKDWKEYKIPSGNRVGKCGNEESYFFGRSMTQYSYQCSYIKEATKDDS